MSTLVADIDKMRDEILHKGRDIGFSGKSADVIEHAHTLLGDQLIRKSIVAGESG